MVEGPGANLERTAHADVRVAMRVEVLHLAGHPRFDVRGQRPLEGL